MFTLDPRELEMPWCRLFDDTLLVKSRSPGNPSPLNDDSVDACGENSRGAGGHGAAAWCKVHAPGVDGAGRGKADNGAVEVVGRERKLVAGAWSRRRQNDVSLSLLATTVGRSGVAAGVTDSGGLDVALPCVCQTISAPSWMF